MRGKLGKLGVLGLAMVVTLSLCGAAFASWSDDLSIGATVQTGKVDLVIEDGQSETWVYKDMRDHSEVISPVRIIDTNHLYVASAQVTHVDVAGDTVTVAYDNLFPGIDFKTDVTVHYYGVPAFLTIEELSASQGLSGLEIWAEILDADGKTVLTRSDIGTEAVPCYQIHECENVTVNLHVRVPQENSLQGLSGIVTFKLAVEQWNTCEEGGLGKGQNLPSGPVSLTWTYPGDDSYFNVTLSGVPDGYTITNGTWNGWCAEFQTMQQGSHTVYLESTIGNSSWNAVNWIINNCHGDPYKYDYYNDTIYKGFWTWGPMQRAIWYFAPTVDYTPEQGDTAWEIINLALTNNASSFVPGQGDLAAVFCHDGDYFQNVFLEVDP